MKKYMIHMIHDTLYTTWYTKSVKLQKHEYVDGYIIQVADLSQRAFVDDGVSHAVSQANTTEDLGCAVCTTTLDVTVLTL